MIVRFVVTASDEVVARRLCLDLGGHVKTGLLNALRHCLATSQETQTNDKAERTQFHGWRLTPSFIAASVCPQSAGARFNLKGKVNLQRWGFMAALRQLGMTDYGARLSLIHFCIAGTCWLHWAQ